MNKQTRALHLTPQRIADTVKTLQALDSLAEEKFKTDHQEEVKGKIPASSAAIAQMVEDLNGQLPGHVILANGHGYRMVLTLFSNVLIACDRPDLANLCMETREPEEL